MVDLLNIEIHPTIEIGYLNLFILWFILIIEIHLFIEMREFCMGSNKGSDGPSGPVAEQGLMFVPRSSPLPLYRASNS